jgi:hypothetical protein
MIEEIYKVPERKDWSLEVSRDVTKTFAYLHAEAVPLQYVTSVPTKVPKGTFVSFDDGDSNGLYYQTGKGTVVGLGIPTGGIIMWSGAVADIPGGWYLCDGTNSTPNLVDRFVVGASVAGTYAVAATGGTAAVTLTGAQSGVPAHTHPQQANTFTQTGGTIDGGADLGGLGGTTQANSAANAASSHDNLPPYYALAYIMKG